MLIGIVPQQCGHIGQHPVALRFYRLVVTCEAEDVLAGPLEFGEKRRVGCVASQTSAGGGRHFVNGLGVGEFISHLLMTRQAQVGRILPQLILVVRGVRIVTFGTAAFHRGVNVPRLGAIFAAEDLDVASLAEFFSLPDKKFRLPRGVNFMAEDAGFVGHRGVLVLHLGELVFFVAGAAESACGVGDQHLAPFRTVGIVAFAAGAILDRLMNDRAVPGLVASHAHLRLLGNGFELVVSRLSIFVAGEAFVLDRGQVHNLAILDLGVADRRAAGFGLLIGYLHHASGGRSGRTGRSSQKHL